MNTYRIRKVLVGVVVASSVSFGLMLSGCVGGASGGRGSVGGAIEISFRINDPVRFDDDEPLWDPQTVVWLEDSSGRYVQTLMVCDWTAMGGWKKKRKTADGTKVTEICPQWQEASGWPEGHSESVVDAITRATPVVGAHTVGANCADLGLAPGTYRYHVQASVAEGHTILCSGTILIGESPTTNQAERTYKPKMHADAGAILSDVKATYAP